jgi:uncharacterized membrane protein
MTKILLICYKLQAVAYYVANNVFKSAVAFFFLFFLHGFSIENGQQGISYNSEIDATIVVI